jgi:hypothetical protein
MTRSVPEKTLEHWVGLSLAETFPGIGLWWPATGLDLIASLCRAVSDGPGKILMLEVKTTESSAGRHRLSVGFPQLKRYLRAIPVAPGVKLSAPAHYVFPVPFWADVAHSWPGPPLVGGTGRSSPGAGWWQSGAAEWFGGWTYVMSAQDVADLTYPGGSTALAAAAAVSGSRRLYSCPPVALPQAGRTWLAAYTEVPWPAAAPVVDWQTFLTVAPTCEPRRGVRWRVDPDGVLNVLQDDRLERVGRVRFADDRLGPEGDLVNARPTDENYTVVFDEVFEQDVPTARAQERPTPDDAAPDDLGAALGSTVVVLRLPHHLLKL